MGAHRLNCFMTYLAIQAVVALSTASNSTDDPSLNALFSFLIALDASLSSLLPQSMIFTSLHFTPDSGTPLYSQSTIELPLRTQSGFLSIQLISLKSYEFKLKIPLNYNQIYETPMNLSITFSPLYSGLRSAYLVIITPNEHLVYYIQAESLKSPYKFQEIYIEYPTTELKYGLLKISNPYEESLRVYIENCEDKELIIMESAIDVAAKEEDEFLVLMSMKSQCGVTKTGLWVSVNDKKFRVPVRLVVRCGERCYREMQLGVIVARGHEYYFEVGCGEIQGHEVIEYRDSNKQNKFQVIKGDTNDREKAIGVLNVMPRELGEVNGVLNISTARGLVSISYTYLAAFFVLTTEKKTLQFTTETQGWRKFCIRNHLPHALAVESMHFSEKSIESNPLIEALPAGSRCINVSFSSVPTPVNSRLTIFTPIGKFILPISHVAPHILLYHKQNNQYTEVHGPLDLGKTGFNIQFKRTLKVTNPNDSPFTLYTIESALCIIPFAKNTILTPQSYSEFELSFKPEASIFSSITFNTSIGLFTYTVHLIVIEGECRLKFSECLDVTPKIAKEENIYMVNTYSVPIKVWSISSSQEHVAVKKVSDEIQPNRQQIIGKVLYAEKHGKIRIDIQKSLTYGDLKLWNSMGKMQDANKTTELVINTDVCGEMRLGFKVRFKKPQLPIKMQSKYGSCKLKTLCAFNLFINNPLEVPLMVRLLIAPDGFEKTLPRLDCSSKINRFESNDEEFENLQSELSRNPECSIPSSEEIQSVAQVNDYTGIIREDSENIDGLSWLLETLGLSRVSDSLECKDYNEKASQRLYLGEKIVRSIPASSTMAIGPIYFRPESVYFKDLSVIIKNNYTVIETHQIFMNVRFAKLLIIRKNTYFYSHGSYVLFKSSLRKEQEALQFEISSEELNRFIVNGSILISPVFFRTFELQNVGNTDAEILGIYIGNLQCSFYGLSLNICSQQFILKPSETFSIELSYSLLLSNTNENTNLVILTADSTYTFPIEIFTPDISKLNRFLFSHAQICLILLLSLTFSAILVTIKLALYINPYKFKSRGTKESQGLLFQQYFCKKYSQAIFFAVQDERVAAPCSTNVEPLVLTETEEPKIKSRSRKKPKIKRNLSNIITGDEAVKIIKKNNKILPEVIATNKLLIERPAKSQGLAHSDSLKEPIEEEESESDEDFYIDYYKTSNQLFGCYSNRESSNLAELTQDSDPIDL